ncbi:MAG: acetylxylan esterase [Thermoguttaceae bacterium]|nr:acetylxylan esterase [Thermoguttaceae bacterium]
MRKTTPFILRIMLISLCLGLIFACTATAQEALAVKSVKSQLDQANHLYQCGQKATFTFTALGTNGKPLTAGHLLVVFTNDNRDTLSQQTFDLSKGNPVTASETMKVPGFMIAKITVTDATAKKNRVNALAGAGFEPEKITPGIPEPADFAQFWADGQTEVRQIPIDVQKKRIDTLSNSKCDIFSVNFATVNNQRVFGYLSVPKQGKGPWPTLVMVPGAGPGTGPDQGNVLQGFVCLYMNVFPYEVPVDVKARQEAYKKYTYGRHYPRNGMPDRNKMFFRPAYLGIDRAVDWLAEQSYVDANRMGVYGSSQGGGSSLILAGMNKHFKACVSNVPAICDHNGLLKGRASGWPHFASSPEDREMLKAASYMDAVYFARRINCPAKVIVGFIDLTCSPSSVYAAYNSIRGPKYMIEKTEMGHSGSPEYDKAVEWLKQEISK